MKYLKLTGIVLLIILLGMIAMQNYDVLSAEFSFKLNVFSYLFETQPLSIYLMIIVTFLFGVILTVFFIVSEIFNLRKRLADVSRQLSNYEEELKSLRNLPVISPSSNEDELSEYRVSIMEESHMGNQAG